MYVEGLELIMRGLTHKTLDFHGECFSFDDVPMELEPLQKPHPPVWYGVHSAVSAERAARQGLNIVSLDPADKTRTFTDRFREVWREAQAKNRIAPLVGLEGERTRDAGLGNFVEPGDQLVLFPVFQRL